MPFPTELVIQMDVIVSFFIGFFIGIIIILFINHYLEMRKKLGTIKKVKKE